MKTLRSSLAIFLCAILIAAISGCGDDDDGPECLQVINSCAEDCNITCPAGKEPACVGPDFGFDNITEDQRCCFCTDV